MSTFDDLAIGERFTTPTRAITDADIDALVAIGGYTHPLFTDPGYLAATPFTSRPMPGEGALHLIGGLVEQTERFDDTTLALLGFREVAFRAPVVAGDEVHVEVEVLEKHERSERSRELVMRWTLRDARGETRVDVVARMLFAR